MGVSTDAILAYGWDLGAEPELDWLDQDNYDVGRQIEDRLLDKIAHFTEKWYQGIDKDYWTRKREAKQSLGVEIIIHCYYDYPMYFLAALGSQIRAYRGTPEIVTIKDIYVGHVWDENLRRAADALGLQIADAPEWNLFSMWG